MPDCSFRPWFYRPLHAHKEEDKEMKNRELPAVYHRQLFKPRGTLRQPIIFRYFRFFFFFFFFLYSFWFLFRFKLLLWCLSYDYLLCDYGILVGCWLVIVTSNTFMMMIKDTEKCWWRLQKLQEGWRELESEITVMKIIVSYIFKERVVKSLRVFCECIVCDFLWQSWRMMNRWRVQREFKASEEIMMR